MDKRDSPLQEEPSAVSLATEPSSNPTDPVLSSIGPLKQIPIGRMTLGESLLAHIRLDTANVCASDVQHMNSSTLDHKAAHDSVQRSFAGFLPGTHRSPAPADNRLE